MFPTLMGYLDPGTGSVILQAILAESPPWR